jgi:hypothetical protein
MQPNEAYSWKLGFSAIYINFHDIMFTLFSNQISYRSLAGTANSWVVKTYPEGCIGECHG